MIGERLRELRLSRNLTLKQLAEETGLSVTFLSLVEREKVSISIDNLGHIARCYGLRLVQLFEQFEDERIFTTRKAQAEQAFTNQGAHSSFVLLSPRHETRMEPLLVRVGPGAGDNQFRTHEGDGFVYVLEGNIRLCGDHQEEVILQAGDSAYYPGLPGHKFQNASAEESALILMVTCPPTSLRDDVLDGRRGLILQSEE